MPMIKTYMAYLRRIDYLIFCENMQTQEKRKQVKDQKIDLSPLEIRRMASDKCRDRIFQLLQGWVGGPKNANGQILRPQLNKFYRFLPDQKDKTYQLMDIICEAHREVTEDWMKIDLKQNEQYSLYFKHVLED